MEEIYHVPGEHGTIAEVIDQTLYDDRSDASDDLEKGRIKFPESKLYGRGKELAKLEGIYYELARACRDRAEAAADVAAKSNSKCLEDLNDDDGGDSESEGTSTLAASFDFSRVVFLSGYSGIGKSALVNEFMRRVRANTTIMDVAHYPKSSGVTTFLHGEEKFDKAYSIGIVRGSTGKSSKHSSSVLCISGKYNEQSSAVAPFSAISQALEKMVFEIVPRENESSKENTTTCVGLTDEQKSKATKGLASKVMQKVGFPFIADPYSADAVTNVEGGENSEIINTKEESEHHLQQSRNTACDESRRQNNYVCWESVRHEIRNSPIIQPGSDGNKILRGAFPVLIPLLERCELSETKSILKNGGRKSRAGSIVRRGSGSSAGRRGSTGNVGREEISGNVGGTSDYAIKESTLEFLSIVFRLLKKPLILSLDDLQWADRLSLEMLQFLLCDRELENVMVVCSFRSNEVDEDHPFFKVMVDAENVRDRIHSTKDEGNRDIASVQRIDLYNLSPAIIGNFISDCIRKEPDEVATLTEVVYQKTMGNIFFVKHAIEELVRKNALYYDMMSFEWQWSVDKVQLSNFMSDDVVETIKGKLQELPLPMQKMVIAMSYIPNALDASILKKIMHGEEFCMEEEGEVTTLLQEASNEGMIIYSVENQTYNIAHDRIRQASREFMAIEERDDLLIRISQVLSTVRQTSQSEWCLYVAVDNLNSIPPEKTDQGDLAKLNFQASKLAQKRGAATRENELLRRGQKCLERSEIHWKEYEFTLHIYNAAIVSEYSLGHLTDAMPLIEAVLENARSLDDKFIAHLNKVLCQCEATRDYDIGTEECAKVLKMYGYDFPLSPTKADIMKEEVLLNIVLRNRPYSYLVNLPVKDIPVFELINHLSRFSLLSGKTRLLTLIAMKAIRISLDKGIDRNLPGILVSLGAVYNKKGKIKKAYALGNVAALMADRFRQHKDDYAYAKFVAYSAIICQLESFQSSCDCLIKCMNDLKLVGKYELALGAGLNYFYAYFAAGYPLNSLLESKMIAAENFAKAAGKCTFVKTFQLQRATTLNLRKSSDNPTEIKSESLEISGAICAAADSQALRDFSSCRLMLAFIFWHEDCMASMLETLSSYPLSDVSISRLHNRLTFVGLAAFAMARAKSSEVFMELGETCLAYFKKLAKLYSVNAVPIYALMKAMKHRTRQSFEKAVKACMETNVTHIQAIATEHFGEFLIDENDRELGEEYLTMAYWFYYDWGAHGKTVSMKNRHRFLLGISRRASFLKRARSFSISDSEASKPMKNTFSSVANFNGKRTNNIRRTSTPQIRLDRVWHA